MNRWNYVESNPINHLDPSGLCIHCQPGDKVKVDGISKDGKNEVVQVKVYMDPRYSSQAVGYVSNNQLVLIESEGPIGSLWQAWRKISFSSPDNSEQISGWIQSIYLLDNCDRGGFFGCLPVHGSYKTQGFGPNQSAKDVCSGSNWDTECPYTLLRGLHNGLDFYGLAGQPVIWAGVEEASIKSGSSVLNVKLTKG